jgi:HK97 family phage major capsid protein
MSDKSKALHQNPETGEVTQHELPGEVDYASVQRGIQEMLPAFKEFGEGLGQSLRDVVEESMETVAKRIEEGRPVNDPPANKYKAHSVNADGDVIDAETREKVAGEYMKAFGRLQTRDPGEAAEYVKHNMKDGFVKDQVLKALSESNTAKAGILVPETIRDQIKEIRDNAVTVRRMAPTPLTLSNGSMTIPKEVALATAYYADENEDLTLTDFALGEDRITLRKLTVLIAASNELLKDGTNVERIINRQMARAFRLKENDKMLRGEGTNGQPRGIVNQIDTNHRFARAKAGADSTVQEIRDDLVKAIQLVMEDNHETDSGAWTFNSTTWAGLFKRLTTDYASAPFAAELLGGRILGQPYFLTNAMPNNLAAEGPSDVLYTLRDYIMIVDAADFEFDASRDASYKSSGSDVSAFSQDQTVYRIIGRHNVHYEYPDGGSVIHTVDW